MKILYIHGLSSSGASNTAETLRRLLPGVTVISPDLACSVVASVDSVVLAESWSAASINASVSIGTVCSTIELVSPEAEVTAISAVVLFNPAAARPLA